MKVNQIFAEKIKNANHIVISTHIMPDADGLGSGLALCMGLRSLGKDAICVNEEPISKRYRYLDEKGMLISFSDYTKLKKKKIDLFIVVDANSPSRIGNSVSTLLERSRQVLYVDHHPSPGAIASIHCIDTKAAATGQIVGNILLSMKIQMTRPMALALYTAITIDTSSFRYPTVNGETHRLLAKLIDVGVVPALAYNKIYGTKKLSHMQLLGKVLSHAQVSRSGQLGWIIVTQKMLDEYKADAEDSYSFINHLLILDKVKIACMFRDHQDLVRVSFRSTGEIDVGIIAEALGGGGHNHSAATTIKGNILQVVPDVIQKLELILKNY